MVIGLLLLIPAKADTVIFVLKEKRAMFYDSTGLIMTEDAFWYQDLSIDAMEGGPFVVEIRMKNINGSRAGRWSSFLKGYLSRVVTDNKHKIRYDFGMHYGEGNIMELRMRNIAWTTDVGGYISGALESCA